MKANSKTLQILINDEEGKAEVQLGDDWTVCNPLWKIYLLSDLIHQLTGHLDESTQEWKTLLDLNRQFDDDMSS